MFEMTTISRGNNMIFKVVYGYITVEEIKAFHLHFQNLWRNKDKMRQNLNRFRCHENYWNDMRVKEAVESIHSFQILDDPTNTETTSTIYNIYYKLDRTTNNPKFIIDYDNVYLYNTLIKELFNTNVEIKVMANWVVYMLYYYRFFRSTSYNEMCNAVLSDIADIIGIIIKKEYSIYLNYNTNIAIEALRWKHKSERVLQLGKAPTNINLRRRF